MIQWGLLIDSWEFPHSLFLSLKTVIPQKNPAANSDIYQNPVVTVPEPDKPEPSGYIGPADTDWTQSPEWILSHQESPERDRDGDYDPYQDREWYNYYDSPESVQDPEYPFHDFNYGP